MKFADSQWRKKRPNARRRRREEADSLCGHLVVRLLTSAATLFGVRGLTGLFVIMIAFTADAATPFYAPMTMELPVVQRELRAAWVASVGNIDWPSKPGLPVKDQKAELLRILDRAVEMNLNAIVLQVRPACDAMYASKIEPWSYYLTGEAGKAPSPYYDPLEFAVAEAHKRGLELHAWFNPYRVALLPPIPVLAKNSIARLHPELVRHYGSVLWLDPGEKAVQDYSLRVVMDVVRRYDIDGVQFDDYFYPYKEKDAQRKDLDFPDGLSWRKYGEGGKFSREDWRRENVNAFVRHTYDSIKSAKPWVKFGIAPFGIWQPGFPKSVRGMSAYSAIYADTRKWLMEGWVDYWSPQLYWNIDAPEQSFPELLKWWTEQNPKHRNLWPGLYSEGVEPKTDAWTFSVGDVRDTTGLLLKLRAKADPVSILINNTMAPEVWSALNAYTPGHKESPTLLPGVIRTLNKLVMGTSLYEVKNFQKINLRPETLRLGQSFPRDQELTHLNRMLLEDAYPQDLMRSKKRRADEILNQIKLTREIENTGAGEVFFSMKSLMQDRDGLSSELARGLYAEPALIPASPWLEQLFPDKPKLKMTGNKMASWTPAGLDLVAWWVLQVRENEHWQTLILPGSTREKSLGSWPDAVALTAVDRCGVASPAVILRTQVSEANKESRK